MPNQNDIKKLKREIKRLKEDCDLVYNDVTNDLIESAITEREEKLKKMEFLAEAQSKEYMKVVYDGGMDYYDGLTTGKSYGVFDENDSQYIVVNDMRSTSSISKNKFKIVG